jgi:hypothetical protein
LSTRFSPGEKKVQTFRRSDSGREEGGTKEGRASQSLGLRWLVATLVFDVFLLRDMTHTTPHLHAQPTHTHWFWGIVQAGGAACGVALPMREGSYFSHPYSQQELTLLLKACMHAPHPSPTPPARHTTPPSTLAHATRTERGRPCGRVGEWPVPSLGVRGSLFGGLRGLGHATTRQPRGGTRN